MMFSFRDNGTVIKTFVQQSDHSSLATYMFAMQSNFFVEYYYPKTSNY